MQVLQGLGQWMPVRQHTWPRHHTTWLPRAPGQVQYHTTNDGDHVATADIHGALGPFCDWAGQFLTDFEGSAPLGQAVEESMEAILIGAQLLMTEPFRAGA